jgi:hypothetical protein
MLDVDMLNVDMLNVVMLSVVVKKGDYIIGPGQEEITSEVPKIISVI